MLWDRFKSFIPSLGNILKIKDGFVKTEKKIVKQTKRRFRDSKKFVLSIVALSILFFAYFSSVAILWFINPPLAVHLVVMYKDFMTYVAVVALGIAGIEGAIDIRHNSNSDAAVTQQNEHKIEDKNININLTSLHKDTFEQTGLAFDYSPEGDDFDGRA